MNTIDLDIHDRDGLVIELMVGVPRFWAEKLTRASRPVPPPVPLRFLIDTGASGVLVEEEWLTSLTLQHTGTERIHSTSSGTRGRRVRVYPICLTIPHADGPVVLDGIEAVTARVLEGEYEGLLGREVLDYCVLVYDGPNQRASLSFDPFTNLEP